MTIHPTPIEGLLIIEPKVYSDDRGLFFESFNLKLRDLGIHADFVQDNQSVSKKNVIRGLHIQRSPHAQGKLVRVSYGAVVDVAVDLRKNSPTFGRHFSVELNDRNNLMFWIPPGFAHGFSVLEDNTVFLYKVSGPYQPTAEGGIIYNDPELNIDWKVREPIVSAKDKVLPSFREYKLNSLD